MSLPQDRCSARHFFWSYSEKCPPKAIDIFYLFGPKIELLVDQLDELRMAKREKIDNFIDPPQEFVPSEVSLQGQGRRSAGRGMVTLMGTAVRVALQRELPRDHPTSHSSQHPSHPHAMELVSILRCFTNILRKLKVVGMSLQFFQTLGEQGTPKSHCSTSSPVFPSHHTLWLHSKSKDAVIYFCWALTFPTFLVEYIPSLTAGRETHGRSLGPKLRTPET